MRLNDAVQLATTLYWGGKLAQAADVCSQLQAQVPDQPLVLNLLGLIAKAAGQLDVAMNYLTKVVQLCPEVAEFHNNLGLVLGVKDRLGEAIVQYETAIRLRPDYGEAYFNLADVLCVQRRWTEALAVFDRAKTLHPHDAQSLRNLATALMQTRQWAAAIQHGCAALNLEPNHASVHVTIGISLKAMQDPDGALIEYQKALAIQPDCLEAINNMANIYRETGQGRRAVECYDTALKFHPSRADVGSNRLYVLNYDDAFDGPALLREHRNWAARYAEPLRGEIQPHTNERSPERRLRVGYVSPNLNAHVVGFNLLPLLTAHDRQKFEIICYANSPEEDEVTNRIRACCDGWRAIHSLDDRQAAELIRADRVDILVDLTLHMSLNRMLVFARKPAPVQATYLAYCGTTGMDAVDYRFSDPYLDPEDADAACYSEKTIRLPGGYWCYQPSGAPPVQASPMLRNGYVMFGCLNSFSKMSPAAIDLWATILAGIPGSRMILHCLPGSHRNGVLQRFAAAGVEAGRIELVGFQKSEEYLRTYDRIDVALDPFPYGGGITTMDAVWMGVPVVTLSGLTAVGRGGRSILSNIGLPELVAKTPQEYAELAGNFGRWIQLRPELRQRMAASTLLDAKRLAREVESAYREMWRRWVG